MRIEPEPLLAFARVADAGSVSAAAVRSHRTQPAVSAQLRKLTDAVGEPLYRRHRSGVRLTAAGEALLPYARALATALEGAQGWADDLGDLTKGTLRLAASMTVAVYHLPPVLASFHQRHPGLRIELLTRNSADAAELLVAGRADLAIVEGPVGPLPDSVETSLYGNDRLVLVVPPGHPLTSGPERALPTGTARGEPRARAVPLRALQGLDVVRREHGSGTREVVDRALDEAGVTVSTVMQATGLDAVKQAVLAGIGAGFLAERAVQREVTAGSLRVVPLDSNALVRPLTLLGRPPGLASRVARAFTGHLEDGRTGPTDAATHAVAGLPTTS